MEHKLQPRIETIQEKQLVGIKMKMSLSHNLTMQLWRTFMPLRSEITNNISTDLVSLQIYDPSYFDKFSLDNPFEKWALIEVENFDSIPNQMKAFILPAGQYAVFSYKGLSNDNSIFNYIFSAWLPNSEYLLDDRPHFEVLGNKYKNDDPTSEEEIWIPIKQKNSGR